MTGDGHVGLAGPLNVEPPARARFGYGRVVVSGYVEVGGAVVGRIEQTHRLIMLGPGWGVLAWRGRDPRTIRFHRTPNDHADQIRGDIAGAAAALVRAHR